MALATSVCYPLEDIGWIHEHLRYLHSQGLARLSSTTSFPNVLQACQGGLLSAGREEAISALGISAGPSICSWKGTDDRGRAASWAPAAPRVMENYAVCKAPAVAMFEITFPFSG